MHDGRVVAIATTDGRGFYTLTGLIAQEYVVQMRKTGYNARTVDVLVSGDTTRDFVMDRNRVMLTGIVREAPPCTGSAINAAQVQILDGPDAGKSSLTDRSGSQYEIAGVAWGTFHVRTSKEGYATTDVTVTVPASDVVYGPFTQNINLPRTARQALFGEVRERRTELGRSDMTLNIALTPNNARLEGTVFDTTSASAPLEGATVEIVSGSGAGQKAVTDATGHYALSGLYGTLVVRASKSGYTSEERTINIRDPVSFWNFGLKQP
jgi:hypothetical protein